MIQEESAGKESDKQENNTVDKPNIEKGLSRRDAIGVALEELGATKEEAPTPPPAVEAPPSLPKYEPPAEYTKEEREDFLQSSPKQQEAALRLHKSRHSTLENIKREKAELQWVKDLVGHVDPYLKARGYKDDPKQAIIDALEMRREIEEKPIQSTAQILKLKGYQPPKELLDLDAKVEEDPEKISLQKRLQAVESKLANEELSKMTSVLTDSWNEFVGTKNAAGEPRFPDVLKEDAGPELARNIGSLIDGVSPLSRQFIASVEKRVPNLTIPKLVEEAYRFLGGSINDSSAPRTQSTQRHLVQSTRAASSVPGRSSLSSSSGTAKKFKSFREAAKAAIEEIRAREG